LNTPVGVSEHDESCLLAPTENDVHPVLFLFAGLLPALTKKWVIHS